MKVLAVIVTPPEYKASGGVTAALELSRHLVGKVDIEVALMGSNRDVIVDGGLRIHSFPCQNSLYPFHGLMPRQLVSLLWHSPQLVEHIKITKPDVVHIHNPHPAGALWQVARSCLENSIPYVISTHGFVEMTSFSSSYGIQMWKSPLVRHLITNPFRKAVARAAHVCMLSPLETEMVSDLGISKEKQSIVTNGFDPFYLERAESNECQSVAERFELTVGVPKLLFVGNHTINKGIDVLLQSLHYIKEPIKAVIVGSIRSKQEHEALCRRYDISRIREKVVFTDFISKSELRVLYQLADSFVFPSRADTLPLVILDAMISGLPTISTTVGSIPYQVTKETGVLVAPNDPVALAAAISDLVRDPERRKQLGQSSYERALRCFNWNQSSSAALDVYTDVIPQHLRPNGGNTD